MSSEPTGGTEKSNWTPYVAVTPLVLESTPDSALTAPSGLTSAPAAVGVTFSISLRSTETSAPAVFVARARAESSGTSDEYSIFAVSGSPFAFSSLYDLPIRERRSSPSLSNRSADSLAVSFDRMSP